MTRILFFGYSAMGYEGLSYLLSQGEDVAAVISHRDKEGENIWFPSVPNLAKEYRIPLYYGEELKRKELKSLVASLDPHLILSIYYRNMIPPSVLKLAPLGAYNLHGSLLPKYRGRCPANWQILFGETRSGVTLHEMERKADVGAIVGQKEVPVGPRDTAYMLAVKQVGAARALLEEVFPLLKRGEAPKREQDHDQATYFGGRKPEDGKIHWSQKAIQIDRLVRAVTHPYPGAFTFFRGKKLLIWEAYPMGGGGGIAGKVAGKTQEGFLVATGESLLEVLKCQWEGEEEVTGAQFWSRFGGLEGEVLE